MPTGYTAELCEKDVPFEKFALDCARAFGALILMRDEPKDAKIPDKFEPNDYNAKALAKAKKELSALKAMTLDVAKQSAADEHRKAVREYDKHVSEVKATANRLHAMRSKVADWTPPSPDHQGLKDFMIEQIDTTLKHDGRVWRDVPVLMSGKAWLESNIEAAERSVQYHMEEARKEVERAEGRTLWVKQLRASLKS